MRLSKITQALKRGIQRTAQGSGWIAGLVIGLLMCMVFADVFGRYVLNNPIRGNADIVTMMLVVAIFLCVSYTQLHKGHIGVELLYSRLSSRTKVIMDMVNSLVGIVIYGLMSWQLIDRVWGIYTSSRPPPTTAGAISIPHAPFYLVAGIGMAILCLVLIIDLFQSFARVRSA